MKYWGKPWHPGFDKPEPCWGLSPEDQAAAFKLTASEIELLGRAATSTGLLIGEGCPLADHLVDVGFLELTERHPHGPRTIARITIKGYKAAGFFCRKRLITAGLSVAP
jgi:hypothetical protein